MGFYIFVFLQYYANGVFEKDKDASDVFNKLNGIRVMITQNIILSNNAQF